MKWFALIGMAVVLTVAVSCRRQDFVHASGENKTARVYQPKAESPPEPRTVDAGQVRGELRSVDLKNRRIVLRVENGMEQTLKFSDSTTVSGLPGQQNGKTTPKDLVGKQGSEVVIRWTEEKGEKLAAAIDVANVVANVNSRKARRR